MILNKLLRIAIIGAGLFGAGYYAGSPKRISPQYLNSDGIIDVVVEDNFGKIKPYYGRFNNPPIDINKSSVSEDSVLGLIKSTFIDFKRNYYDSPFTRDKIEPIYKKKKTDSLFN